MIVAGIGCRRGVRVDEVLAAIDAALAAQGVSRDRLVAIATTAFKRDESAILAAGRALGLKLVVVEPSELRPSRAGPDDLAAPAASPHRPDASLSNSAQDLDTWLRAVPRRRELGEAGAVATLTCSPLSLAHAGTSSVSEAAALAAIGPGARLLGPRTILGRVTCAIAAGDAR